MATERPSTVDAASLPPGATGALPETCRASAPAGTPLILDAGSRALYLGPSFTLGGHRNTVAVLAFGLDGGFTLQGEDDASPTLRRSALIAPGRWQQLDARGGAMAFLYLDADDRGWRALARRHAAAVRDIESLEPIVEAAAVALLQSLHHRTRAPADGWNALLCALDLPPPQALDAGIAAAMARVQRTPGDAHPVATHAQLAGCAVSTFQRRFTAQAGLPWRRWRLWQRLRHAARLIGAGSALTDAAHAAGFASGAHFSDAFKATFGLPPLRLVDWGVRWESIDRD
ncbi:MAG: helix-turn-helix domain-containing protein [Silanimonas sp.]